MTIVQATVPLRKATDVAEILRGHTASAGHDVPDELLAAVTDAASRAATDWFPDLTGEVRVRPLATDVRARCYLHHVELVADRASRRVVVKVRHSEAPLRRRDMFEDRPLLTPERTMPDRETARREYDGLLAISRAIGGSASPGFGVLRPLAWLPDQAAIVMEVVKEHTLRHRVLATARPRRRGEPVPDRTWQNVGAWLRAFQDAASWEQLPARLATRDEVADLCVGYADFLTERLGRVSSLSRVGAHARTMVGQALPEQMPLAPGHGDFVANNIFADTSGRITVFDPLVRWQVPRYQDLATLTVGLRVLPVQSASIGLAIPDEELLRYERGVLAGYFGDVVPHPAVRLLQLVVLLDRWSATVSKQVQRGRLRRGLHSVRVAVASQHYRREVHRVLSLLDG